MKLNTWKQYLVGDRVLFKPFDGAGPRRSQLPGTVVNIVDPRTVRIQWDVGFVTNVGSWNEQLFNTTEDRCLTDGEHLYRP